ncbi:MAG: histidine kinase [Puia sp.]|nr:histidine kinase [Puia sp.]
MKIKRPLLLLVGLFLFLGEGFAQRITIFGKAPVRIEGEGFLLPKMRNRGYPDSIGNCPKDKIVPIYLAGSRIDMRTTDNPSGTDQCFSDRGIKNDTLFLDHYKRHRFYCKTYYTQTPISGPAWIVSAKNADRAGQKRILQDNDDLLYAFLKVNDFFFVDFLDYDTDSLVRRYYVKRLKVTPEIEAYRPLTDGYGRVGQQEGNSIAVGGHDKILLSPDKKNRLILSMVAGLPDSTIQYNLINLRTRDTIYHNMGGSNMIIPSLVANTEYALQLNYSMQPETIVVYYIQTRPYWYQSGLFYILAVVLILLAVAGVAFWALRRKISLSRRKQLETEQRLRTVQSQLNPHFTFNALNSIQGLINTHKIDEANHYLQSFSLLLRQTLSRSQHIYNTLDRDMDMIRTYVGIEKLRFDFTYEIRLPEHLCLSDIEVPTLLIQPLVENAIKHGISGLGTRGRIEIVCKEGSEPGSLILSVKDNGRGFVHPISRGYGIKLTQERITAINQLTDGKSIDLLFRGDPGTEAVLTFHHWIVQSAPARKISELGQPGSPDRQTRQTNEINQVDKSNRQLI